MLASSKRQVNKLQWQLAWRQMLACARLVRRSVLIARHLEPTLVPSFVLANRQMGYAHAAQSHASVLLAPSWTGRSISIAYDASAHRASVPLTFSTAFSRLPLVLVVSRAGREWKLLARKIRNANQPFYTSVLLSGMRPCDGHGIRHVFAARHE